MLVEAGPPDSAINRALYGAWGQWSALHELLALVVDVLQVANWQRGGGRGGRPRRITRPRRPGQDDPNATTYGGAASALPIDEMDAYLGWDDERAGVNRGN